MNNAPSNNLSECFSGAVAAHQKGDLISAVALYRKVLDQKKDHLQSWLNMGLALRGLGEKESALHCFQTALSLDTKIPGAHLAMGAVLRDMGKLEEAADCCRQEIKLNATNADAHYNLGLIRHNQERFREAIQCYEKTLKINPNYVDALVNYGCIQLEQDQVNSAKEHFEKALKVQPLLARAHWSLARALLLSGDYVRGFEEHEWRWKMNDFTTPKWSFSQPLWQGEPLDGKTILLHAEQGAGDTIQFIRYVPMVAARGGRIIVGCPSDLAGLIRTIPGINEVVTTRENLPHFDVHAPVMSLPRIFGTTLETVPAKTPYLGIPEAKPLKLPSQDAQKEVLRLGFVWAGGVSDQKRNLPLELVSFLAELPNLQLYSLQVGPKSSELQSFKPGMIIDCSPLLKNFSDTAQVLNQLDGVITVDTSVAHLAGALGRPTWTLLHFSADWRWLRQRTDSPWYPTLRLFRQNEPGNWKPVIQKLKLELEKILGSPRPAEAFARSVKP